MVAKAYVQATTLAGLTPDLARHGFRSEVEAAGGRIMFGDRRYDILAVRIAPPLKVARRFRAAVTWVPVRGEMDGLETS